MWNDRSRIFSTSPIYEEPEVSWSRLLTTVLFVDKNLLIAVANGDRDCSLFASDAHLQTSHLSALHNSDIKVTCRKQMLKRDLSMHVECSDSQESMDVNLDNETQNKQNIQACFNT